MTIIIPSPARKPGSRPGRPRGFTLVEILIGSTLSAFILVGVLSTFLFLGRSGANIQNYNDMESQARRALEQFAQDTRQARTIEWLSAERVRMQVDTFLITYEHASGSLIRTVQAPSPALPVSTTLLSGITVFAFKAYTITGAEIPGIGTTTTLASAGQTTKQLQISLQASRTSRTVTTATNTVLSARFILRNKRVTA
ncbi:MAG: prepilin-type N-terminal cleavage/methylation domain-containing protein [Verrucomicrobia bacterium]|jgi:prepilin-type N-terminal cleavage/methylation domain-containing protein|nr:prepilin-type N-terminal cleavage/methylation domain-containing protein [Verrucomicrobiota bacterium]